MKSLYLFFALVLLTAFAGCRSASPIYESSGVPIPQSMQSRDSLDVAVDVVRHSLVSRRGWYIQERLDDRVRIGIEVRVHSATVDILVEDGRLTPVLVSSVNLEQENGRIHPSFNTWMQNLEQDMRRALSDMAAPGM